MSAEESLMPGPQGKVPRYYEVDRGQKTESYINAISGNPMPPPKNTPYSTVCFKHGKIPSSAHYPADYTRPSNHVHFEWRSIQGEVIHEGHSVT